MKKSSTIKRKPTPKWYDNQQTAAMQKTAIYNLLDEFSNFASAADVSELLHELLSHWLTSPDNKNASLTRVTNMVYETTGVMTFIARLFREWESARYITLRDKGID